VICVCVCVHNIFIELHNNTIVQIYIRGTPESEKSARILSAKQNVVQIVLKISSREIIFKTQLPEFWASRNADKINA
jgi:hypothetical protein